MSRILEALTAAGARTFSEARSLFEAAPYCLRVTDHGPLYALRYQKNQSDFRSQVVRQARGIVLEKDTNRIVSYGFDKFYEYGEAAPSYRERPNLRLSVPDPKARYERKYDGVLIKVVVRPDGELLVSTNGRIDAATAPMHGPEGTASAADMGLEAADAAARAAPSKGDHKHLRQAFEEAGGLKLPYNEGLCYAFELMHPDIPTVIPATRRELVHLTTRRLEAAAGFPELPVEERYIDGALVASPEVLNFGSFGACRAAAWVLPWDCEGYVVADSNNTRVKVKSEAYKSMQRLVVGDSEVPEEDALAVALTLRGALRPLPPVAAPLVEEWRSRAEAFAHGAASRLSAAARSSTARGLTRSARHARGSLEAAVGGRFPHSVRSALAGAFLDMLAQGGSEACEADMVLEALGRSKLSLADMRTAVSAV